MIRRSPLVLTLVTFAVGTAGCDAPGPTTRPGTNPTDSSLTTGVQTITGTAAPGDAPPPAGATTIHVDVYLLDVPAGSVSGDESLWRTVDENAVGVFADQRLQANGIRCGVAPRSQWRRLSGIFAKELHRARHTKVNGLAAETIDLPVDQPVDREDLFFLAADGQWEGHTYDHATNGLTMTFGPTPRLPGSVRLSFCPTVKRQQRALVFTPLNQPYEEAADDVARIYDAGLTADVPADGFFIVAPSPMADPADLTVGGRFLVRRDPAAEREQIVIAVPSLVPLDGSVRRVPQQ